MSRYVIRMEQMAIGAALRGMEPLEAAYLRPEDFVYPVGGQLYTTAQRERQQRPDASTAELVAACAARFADPDLHLNRWTLHAMTELAATADAGELTAVYRQILATGVSNQIDRCLDDIRYRPWNDHEFELLAGGQTVLSEAIHRRTETLSWLSSGVDHLTDDMIERWDRQSPYPTVNQHNPEWLFHESVILSGLMQHPRSAWMLGSLIGPDTFSTALHRDTYTAILRLAADGYQGPMSAVDVYYQVERHRWLRLAETTSHGADPDAEKAHLEGLATGAAVTPLETAGAVRELLVSHDATRIPRPQAPATELLDPPAVSTAALGLTWK